MKLHGFYKYILIIILLISSSNGFTQSSSYLCKVQWIDPVSVLRTVNSVSTVYNGETIGGKYLTILGKNHTSIEKPFILIEGIDPTGEQYFDDHIDLFNNDASSYTNALIYNLYENGFDVIILDFNNSTREIQDNAMLLVKLIEDVYDNNSLTEDNFVVMGYSMGGLVARYALTWMEANDQNHHTRLFISHDSPQKGANFPLGLQELIQDMKTNGGGVLSIATSFLFLELNNDFPAMSQMLIYHYINSNNGIARPSDESLSFFSELYNMSPSTNGYPARPVKIATSNGNFSGIPQKYMGTDINPGDNILDFYYSKNNGMAPQICNLWQIITNTCPPASPYAPDVISVNVKAGFDATQPIDKFYIYSMGKEPIGTSTIKIPAGGSGQQTFLSSNLSYDMAPGSYSSANMNIIKNGIANTLGVTVTGVNTTCFIPTISALDLNIGINDSFDLNSSQCYTNFDYIYANTSTNNDHWRLEPGAKQFIMNHVLASETPRQKYYFSAENLIIPANQVVNSSEQYNKTAKYTLKNDGAFIVNSGASATLVAGQEIEMKPGFSVENGGAFTATIGYIDLMCENEVMFVPRKIASGLIPDPVNTSIQKNYDCSNYTEMPNYNSSYRYFDCESELAQINNESVDSVLNTKINVYPNPTTGLMNIQFSEDIPINNLTIKIYDLTNNLIYTIDSVNSYDLTFNLPSCMPGLLTVQFIFNNPSYIYSRKILKQ